jgi:hypothetical protein
MYRYNVAISNVVDKEGIYSTSKFKVLVYGPAKKKDLGSTVPGMS